MHLTTPSPQGQKPGCLGSTSRLSVGRVGFVFGDSEDGFTLDSLTVPAEFSPVLL